MPEQFTTIRIFAKDKPLLLKRFGAPSHEAVRKAIDENCPHPEEKRSYMTADLPIPTQEAGKRHTLGGFYCAECGRFIFKAPTAKQR
jgi:hypothetical protein